jgi:hypothetical protein
MRDTELYRAILGLESPWTVARVELDVKQQRVDVYAEHGKRKAWPCPECEASCGLHDHDEERTWRHLDSCQFQTYLHASVPRIHCDEHGVRQVRVPWAEPRSRFTLLFERFAIDVLHETDILGAARILGITWDEAHGIMARAVARGLLRREHTVAADQSPYERRDVHGRPTEAARADVEADAADVAPFQLPRFAGQDEPHVVDEARSHAADADLAQEPMSGECGVQGVDELDGVERGVSPADDGGDFASSKAERRGRRTIDGAEQPIGRRNLERRRQAVSQELRRCAESRHQIRECVIS